MIYEFVGTRVLAPYIGTSTYVWTSLIGVILGSLSLGYWVGGIVADRKLGQEVFAGIIFFAAAIIGITSFLRDPILSIIEKEIYDVRLGAVLASLILFSPASVMLGMVSPYAVKLKSKALDEIGSTVGNLYAFSTVGSIFGTFLTGFYLIPHLGTNNILVLISLTLTSVAVMALPSRMNLKKIILFVYILTIIVTGDYLSKRYNGPFPTADIDTEYSRVQIIDESYRENVFGNKKDVRFMRLGNVLNSGIYLNDETLLLPHTKYFRLSLHFKPDALDSLMIGGEAFIYPRDYLHTFPNATMDVVEIDARLADIAREYFGLRDDKRLSIINQDGRTFINRSHKQYDIIFCDAFSSTFIPFHLSTQNAVKQMLRILKSDGVAFVNIISSIEGDDGKFLRAEYASFRSVFPQVYLFPVQSANNGKLFQNIMLIALKSDKLPAMKSENPEINDYLTHLWRKNVPQDLPVLTDNHAPVEHYIGLHTKI